MRMDRTRAKVIFGDSRAMPEVEDCSVQLALTSPPYWQIKDYGTAGQIGRGQSLHDYLKDLYLVWSECRRVLLPGRRLCVNIGDQFARAKVYGRYKVIPLHAEVIAQAEAVGFDYLGSIIWQKKTTLNSSGGAVIMGSYPHPPNGVVEIDYEFILIFKKPGPPQKIDPGIKAASALTKEEWKRYFAGHWHFGGAKKTGHEAVFPLELPLRLIRMFSFAGETILDPFLGSGTTLKAARELGRNGIGFEINPDYGEMIRAKMESGPGAPFPFAPLETLIRETEPALPSPPEYEPAIQDANPLLEPEEGGPKKEKLFRVKEVRGPDMILLSDGRVVSFLGLKILRPRESEDYLRRRLKGKMVYLRTEDGTGNKAGVLPAYVYLKNRLFINAYLLKSGLAEADRGIDFRLKNRFLKWSCQSDPGDESVD